MNVCKLAFFISTYAIFKELLTAFAASGDDQSLFSDVIFSPFFLFSQQVTNYHYQLSLLADDIS